MRHFTAVVLPPLRHGVLLLPKWQWRKPEAGHFDPALRYQPLAFFRKIKRKLKKITPIPLTQVNFALLSARHGSGTHRS